MEVRMRRVELNGKKHLWPSLVLAVMLLMQSFWGFALEDPDQTDKLKERIVKMVDAEDFADAEGFCKLLPKKKRIRYFLLLLDRYLEIGKYERTLRLGEALRPSASEYAPELAHRIGRAYMGLDRYPEAVEVFNNAIPSAYRAQAYGEMADRQLKRQDLEAAKILYGKAVKDYKYVLKAFFHRWTNEYAGDLRRCIRALNRLPKTPEEKKKNRMLKKMLKGVAHYCEKMKNSAFHFFCNEKVHECMDYTVESLIKTRGNADAFFTGPNKMVKNYYVFEYQLIQEEKEVKETRTLVKQNGNSTKVENARLNLAGVTYGKLIFGPIELMPKNKQSMFHYEILREETLWDEPVVVIEALPAYSARQLFGKVWISKKDYAVLRIEWNPKSIRQSLLIEKRARWLNTIPMVTFYAEFNKKRRGIRFPTRYYFEEAYTVNKRKRERYQLDVKFSDFMFFVVGSEVVEAGADLESGTKN
jgi:tetratricopeptide (TPR) repeat protein